MITPYRRSKPVAIASDVNDVDITASASTPGVKTSTGRWARSRPTWSAPLTPPTSTITGITTASSSCSPLRSISRASMPAWAATIRGNGRGARARGEGRGSVAVASSRPVSSRNTSSRVRWPRVSDSGARRCASHQRDTIARLEASAGPVTTMLTSSSSVTSTRAPSARRSDSGASAGNGLVTTSRIVAEPPPRVSSSGVPLAIRRPWSMMWIRSASRSASSM